jgi:hypothetical protein
MSSATYNVAPHAKAGRARATAIAAEVKARRERLAAEIIADLHRRPSALDKVAAEHVAALSVRACMLEDSGQVRAAAKARNALNRAIIASGLRPAAPSVTMEPEPETAA